jgi:acyl-CoA thioesterase II
MKQINELIDLLRLERIEVNLFRGQSRSVGSSRVFGGQVLAQSLSAAFETVPADRFVHSLHGYFVLPGDIEAPIVFEVDRIRDGGSFTTRGVKAIQHGHAIFQLTASFQLRQEGFEHQQPMPRVSPPEELPGWDTLLAEFGAVMPPNLRRLLDVERPIEFRPVEIIDPLSRETYEPVRHIWMKTKGTMPAADARMHQLVMAYASDYNLLTTALLPHGYTTDFSELQLASIDHAMWFHRPFAADEWLLYATESPSASGARGFTRGNIFSRNGDLVASVAQEGLMRKRG